MKLTKQKLQQIIKEELENVGEGWNSDRDAEAKEALPQNWAKAKAAIDALSQAIPGGYLMGTEPSVGEAAKAAENAISDLEFEEQYQAALQLLMNLQGRASERRQNIDPDRDLGT
jgi:hypothetical protein